MFFFCCKTLLQHLTVLPLLGYLLIPFMHPITLSLFDRSNLLQFLDFRALPPWVPFSKMVRLIFLFFSSLSRWFWLESYLLTELSSSCGILAQLPISTVSTLFLWIKAHLLSSLTYQFDGNYSKLSFRICFLLPGPYELSILSRDKVPVKYFEIWHFLHLLGKFTTSYLINCNHDDWWIVNDKRPHFASSCPQP